MKLPANAVSILGVFCLTIILLTACGREAPAPGNIIHLGNRSELQDLDPHVVTGVAEWRTLAALFQGLADLDPVSLEPVPGVASSWTVSNDGLTYVFTLRPEARWSNGDHVTAHDFAYAWQRILSPALGSPYAYLLHCLKNARRFNAGELADFGEVGVSALDKHRLQVTLENPTPYFLKMHTHFTWFPVHRATIEAHGSMTDRNTGWTRPENFVSNGAYALKDWRPDEVMELMPNSHFWASETLKNDGLRFFPISDEQTEERAFRDGTLHMTYTVPMLKVDHYRETAPEALQIHPYLGLYFYRFNTQKAPLDDGRVRRALSLAIDREALANHVLKAGEAAAWHFVPPSTGDFESTARVAYDPVAAKALLAEAGFPDGEGFPTLELLYNASGAERVIVEAVQRMWHNNLGVDITLANQDYKVYIASMQSGDYDIARSIWIGDVADPVNFLELFIGGHGNNRTGWASASYDKAIRGGYAEADAAARNTLLRGAEEELLDALPMTPVYFFTQKYLMTPALHGVEFNSLGYFRWQDFELIP
jgi:oligopeptide transport system substrate-binding protein